jgi:RND family efflux transporter MFP subunit
MNILTYIKSHKVFVGIILFVVIGASWFFFGRGKSTLTYETEITALRDVIEEVDVTGVITPVHDVSLAFETGGRVASVVVDVGGVVYTGQTLAYLSNADLYADRAAAVARRDASVADLAELLSGTREEDVAVYEAKVRQADQSLLDAGNGVVRAIETAFTQADNAVRNDVDQLFSNPNGSNPSLDISLDSPSLENEIEWTRASISDVLNDWDKLLLHDDRTIRESVKYVEGYAQEIRSFLQKVALAVNTLDASGSVSQTIIDGYKLDISTARTSINTALTSLASAKEGYASAEQNLIVAERQRDAAKAPATPEQIAAAQATLAAAEADVSGYDVRIAKTVITAPVSGMVTFLDVDPGEIVAAGTEVVRVISTGSYEIEAYIPEADITSVRVGDTALFTLDAYDDDVELVATVSMIDPAETVIEGVSTYKVMMHFDDSEELVRSGMTANVTISTDMREDVIAVPSRAVETREGERIVRVMTDAEEPEERTVTTGLRGSDGYIEITSGLSEGEEVVVFVRE